MSNGKGSKRRPTTISQDKYNKNWELIFKKGTEHEKKNNSGNPNDCDVCTSHTSRR